MEKKYIDSDLVGNQLRNMRQVVFEVTDACNLNCKYCGYGELYGNYDERGQKNLPVEKAMLFLDYITSYWKKNPSLSPEKYIYVGFYGGEPLLNMGFIERVVNYLKDVAIPYKEFHFNMTTNAMLLDRHMDYLVENNFSILVSLDGDEYNHSYRVDHAGKNSFVRVISNVELLREKYPLFFNTNVNFNAVLHNRNSVSDIHRFINERFDKKVGIGELNTSGIAPEMHQEFWKTYKNKSESLFNDENSEELQEKLFLESTNTSILASFIHKYSGNVFNTYNDLFIEKDKMKIRPTGTCLPFGKKAFITVNGKILPCEHIGQNYTLGKITDKEVLINFDEIVEKYNNWFQKFEKQCSKCFNKRGCEKCFFEIPNLDADPVCNEFMNKNSYEYMIQMNMSYLRNNPGLYRRIIENVIIK